MHLYYEEDSGLSDEEQRKELKNRPKHTRKRRMHQAKKNFLKKFKTVSAICKRA
ncbi:hypothetical protein [Bacteroides gallinaceum]|uniref:hypothetical protein n=1 Tax=Bacteroides gallinaceum TaxID=1462571 RepID=UPI0025AB494D|nr:hypothetical protein [Bacteroides gallinaceum]MDN0064959.1 hypothetical protein [Bacteroides gallinaceum]